MTAVYLRISSDEAGEGLGVQRQEAACRALADGRGWVVGRVYVDNDISAFSGKRRPAYLEMLDAIADGTVGRIIAWHGDRLHRSPTELETFINLIESTGCAVETVQSGNIDLRTATGRLNARVVGSFARYESEQKSDRIRLKLKQNAEAGKHHGGSRPYGWNEDRVSLNAAEAAIVRFAAERLIAGASVKSIVRDVNATEARNTVGGEWRDVTIRSLLMRQRNSGLRIHHGEVIGDGTWDPILTREEMEAVTRILTSPGRRTTPGAMGRTRLLSGIASCGVCGASMRAAQGKAYKDKRKPIYRCHGKACVTRDASKLDDLVTAVVCARLAREDAADLLLSTDGDPHAEARAEAERLRQKLLDAADDYAADIITREQMSALTAKLRPAIATLEVLTTPPPAPIGALRDLVTSIDVVATWAGLDVRQRREIVAMLVTVSVQPTRSGPGFDAAAVEIGWRSGA